MNMYTIVAIVTVALVVIIAVWIFNSRKTLKIEEKRSDDAWEDLKVYCSSKFDQINEVHGALTEFAPGEEQVINDVARAKNFIAIAWQKDEVKSYVKGEEEIKALHTEIPAVARRNPKLGKSDAFIRAGRNLIGDGPGSNAEREDAKRRVEEALKAQSYYNDVTYSFNNKIDTAPTSVIAKLFGIKANELAVQETSDSSQIEITG